MGAAEPARNISPTMVLRGCALACLLFWGAGSHAQSVADLKTPERPLVLAAQGSFFVGGESVAQTPAESAGFLPSQAGGHNTLNQMYVEYMKPVGSTKAPVVMVHGGGLSSKSWETTPDGRMGWDEYFIRKGHAVYKADQVARARSGFNQGPYNDVRAGVRSPASQPIIIRLSDEASWAVFRFGPTFGTAYPDEQFPLKALTEFSKQGIPDLIPSLPSPNPNYQALADLAIELKGAVLMGHSESGFYPEEAALANPMGVKAMISLEPGGCAATNAQIPVLAKIPILVVFGDHLDAPIQGFSWQNSLKSCQTFVDAVNAAGGKARIMHLPELGIHGNSHMMMLDKNNLQVADLILAWIDKRETGPRR